MKLTYLGTAASSGWPAIFCECEHCEKARAAGGRNVRTRSHALVDDRISIDFPPDAYMHILKENLRPWEWTAIVFTHTHPDHFNPDDIGMIVPSFSYTKGKTTVYGNIFAVGGMLRVINERDPQRKWLDAVLVESFKPFTHGRYKITPLRADHERSKICHIYMVDDGEKRLLYAHDSGYFPEDTWDYIKGTRFDLVSLDCCYGVDMGNRRGHMSLDVCAEAKERLLSSGCDKNTRFVVNSFSHSGRAIHDEMAVLAAEYGMETAYDGMAAEF